LLSASTAVVGTPTYPDPKQQIFENVDSILKIIFIKISNKMKSENLIK
jgi:hypothetical protein